jgi:hypothetical protein
MTATIGLFTAAQVTALSAPHVVCTMLARLHLYDGILRLHPGYGTITVDGDDYRGVTDPGQTRVVSISEIEEPRVGVASAVEITLAGVNAAFLSAIRADYLRMEGRACDLMFALFDTSTGVLIGAPVNLLIGGSMTAPRVRFERPGGREFRFTVESLWSARNFTPAGKISDADQKRRSAGDKACRHVGSSRIEKWPINES